MAEKNSCYILSGVSGAGKSTWIQKQEWAKHSVTYSADHFFMKDGTYNFDFRKLDEAHSRCLRMFIEGCIHGSLMANNEHPSIIVVDNTNTTVEEIAPYYAIANAYGYKVTLVTLLVELEEAAKRNLHGVPLKSIRAMNARIQDRRLPKHWNIESIIT